jgi:hypothetical protein
MGLIREPLDIDFVVDPKPLTDEDKKAISDYIKADKLRRAKVKTKAAQSKPTRLKRTRSKAKA